MMQLIDELNFKYRFFHYGVGLFASTNCLAEDELLGAQFVTFSGIISNDYSFSCRFERG